MRIWLAAAVLVGACGTTTMVMDPDVCDTAMSSSAGSVELGRGGATDYVPMADGDTFPVVQGPQGLWMFVVGARVDGLDIADGDSAAAWFSAVGPAGEPMSLDFGCSERNFEATADGAIQMSTAFPLAIFPDYSQLLAGGSVKLTIIVRDLAGHEATTERTVVATMSM